VLSGLLCLLLVLTGVSQANSLVVSVKDRVVFPHEDIPEYEERTSGLGHIQGHEACSTKLRQTVGSLRLRLEHEEFCINIKPVLSMLVAQDIGDSLQIVHIITVPMDTKMTDHTTGIRRGTCEELSSSIHHSFTWCISACLGGHPIILNVDEVHLPVEGLAHLNPGQGTSVHGSQRLTEHDSRVLFGQ